ncbi:MAG TPA: acyl-CoA dehydrogenase, partial [Woeseiaceae bacterium]|nr:acyl-CoA dehydrogenase [Woeseiaceae bacterium]
RNVRVGPDQVVGGMSGLGNAWEVLRVTGSIERLMVASMAAGLATAVVQRAIEFAKTREQFGRRIAAFQSIQHTLVDMHITAAAMDHFVNAALCAYEQGSESAETVCMAKAYCSEQLQVLVAQGMRVVGGRGYFGFERMSRYYREAPFTLYAGGTVEIQKMLIARSLGLDEAPA